MSVLDVFPVRWSYFERHLQFVIFSEMYKTTAMQFQPSQQKRSLLQAIPKHAIVNLQVHNIIGDNLIV